MGLVNETALLFFSRTAASEAANKAFVNAKNRKTNIKAASLFIQNSRKVAISSGLPVYELNEHKQIGDGFGERLANALEGVFNAGFENVIVIGNDCPQLTGAIINTAAEELVKNQLVLGPDSHGGVYLIGLNRKIFQRDSFISGNWQTSHLFQDLQEIFIETPLYKLPVLKDVNNFGDLISLKDFLPSIHRIKALVTSILASLSQKYSRLHDTYNTVIFSSFGLRAPPIYS
jgi:glycosyltransferase A (GT-A) superfamily protein (DUF2064 family)